MNARTTPSREFFVRQAVLNWVAHVYPRTIAAAGLVSGLSYVLKDMGITKWDHLEICKEYRALTAQYQVQS